MRTATALLVLATAIGSVGCKKKSAEPMGSAGSAGSAMAGSADTGSAGSAMGSAMGSGEGSGSAMGSAGSGAVADGAMSQKGGNCPSFVLGSKTTVALKGKEVIVSILSDDKDAVAAIQKRAEELLKEKADGTPPGTAHDQKGTHGGATGICPIYVPEGATAKPKNDKKGVVVTITPKDKPDALKSEIDVRIPKAEDWVKTNVKPGDQGNTGGVGGGKGEHGSNHSGEGDGKGKERKAGAGGPVPDACTKDADCTLTEDCCGCSSGGEKVAISASAAKEFNATKAARCGAIACATVMSDHPSCVGKAKAVCQTGHCKVATGGGGGGDGSGGGKGTGGGGGKGSGGGGGSGQGGGH